MTYSANHRETAARLRRTAMPFESINLLVKLKKGNFATTFLALFSNSSWNYVLFCFAKSNIDDADFRDCTGWDCKEDALTRCFLCFWIKLKTTRNHLVLLRNYLNPLLTKLENEEISVFIRWELLPLRWLQPESPEHPSVHFVRLRNRKSTIRNIIRTHPSGLWDGIQRMLNQQGSCLKFHLADRLLTEVQFSMH